MGVVYKALDTKLGRSVALKFLPPQWSHDEGAKQRFLREAQAASATNHRNICIIHDIEHTGDGQLFIVMAYYEGQTLKEKLEGGALPFADALEIATEVADGLAKAHAQGVVHRDVKPGNLMVTDDGVKMLDFGLAKFADSLQLTMPGSTIGTVAYMSPEQARGEEADARSDVWALGVVMYEMLTGRVPFSGTYPEATFHAIKNEPVPPLSRSDRDIPAALQTLVSRALEKDPERRYQTAREMARDLRLLQGRTVPLDLRTEQLGPLPASLYGGLQGGRLEPVTWSTRMRRAITPARAATAVIAIVAVAAGIYAWVTRPVVRIPIAIAPVANHTGEPELDAYRMALTQALVDEVSDSPNVRVVPYLRLLEIVRRFIGAGDASSSDAIQAIATQGGASFVVVPSLEYRNATWLAQVQIRNVDTGTVMNSYETDALTSSLPKDTALRQIALLAEKVQAHFKANGPNRSYTRRPTSARFRNLDAAKAFEEGLNAYEQLEYSTSLAAFERATSRTIISIRPRLAESRSNVDEPPKRGHRRRKTGETAHNGSAGIRCRIDRSRAGRKPVRCRGGGKTLPGRGGSSPRRTRRADRVGRLSETPEPGSSRDHRISNHTQDRRRVRPRPRRSLPTLRAAQRLSARGSAGGNRAGRSSAPAVIVAARRRPSCASSTPSASRVVVRVWPTPDVTSRRLGPSSNCSVTSTASRVCIRTMGWWQGRSGIILLRPALSERCHEAAPSETTSSRASP